MIFKSLKTIVNNLSKRNIVNYCNQNMLDVHPIVRNALEKHEPVVALESTIITHGMPYPQNLETAIEVENVVRSVGATPATIACINGRLKVGLSTDNIVQLAEMNKGDVIKSSRRDLPYVISNEKCGGTTVAATMIVANMVGIKIFATGGVGGVHREGHTTMDVSADLVELGQTPVTVVSSGVKSILDIPRTLEYLETHGVCVAAFNNESKFPDFYTRDSGCKAPYNLDNPQQAANLIKTLHRLQLQSGILIGVPIPHEHAVDKEIIDKAIRQASEDAITKGIKGKDVTPFLLAAISEITQGTSLLANIALIKNNAKVAAEIACEISKSDNTDFFISEKLHKAEFTPPKPLIIGACMLDFCLTLQENTPLTLDGATYPIKVKESAGGVGRNLADSICKLYGAANFISVVGKDNIGRSLLQLIPESMRHGILVDEKNPTSTCSILLDKHGNCKMCLANMEIHKSITPQKIEMQEKWFQSAPLVVIDANLSLNTIKTILEISIKYNKTVLFEPTDMLVAGKPFELDAALTKAIRVITPNVFELKSIAESIARKNIDWNPNSSLSSLDSLLSECKVLLKLIDHQFDCILVTLGAHGVLVNLRGNSFDQRKFDKTGTYIFTTSRQNATRFYAALTVENIANVSGAGDSFSSGFITGLLRGLSIHDSILLGFAAAKCSLQSNSAVPEQFFNQNIEELENNENNSVNFKDI